MTVNERVRTLRRAKDITQEELGKLINVNKSRISRFEKGATLRKDKIEVLLKYLDPAYNDKLKDSDRLVHIHAGLLYISYMRHDKSILDLSDKIAQEYIILNQSIIKDDPLHQKLCAENNNMLKLNGFI